MTIKLHCNACEKLIREVSDAEARTVTGKELCNDCDIRMKQVFQGIEEARKKYKIAIDLLYDEMKKEYNKFSSLHQQKKSQVDIILNNIKSEIEKMVQEIFEKRKKGSKQ